MGASGWTSIITWASGAVCRAGQRYVAEVGAALDSSVGRLAGGTLKWRHAIAGSQVAREEVFKRRI